MRPFCQEYPPAGLGLRLPLALNLTLTLVRTTPRPEEMWAIDGTACMTDQGNATVFVVIDHCTGECLAARATQRGTRHEAIDTIRQAIRVRTKCTTATPQVSRRCCTITEVNSFRMCFKMSCDLSAFDRVHHSSGVQKETNASNDLLEH